MSRTELDPFTEELEEGYDPVTAPPPVVDFTESLEPFSEEWIMAHEPFTYTPLSGFLPVSGDRGIYFQMV